MVNKILDFNLVYNDYFLSEKDKSVSKYLNTPKLSPPRDTTYSRLLNHWEKVGVLDDERKGGRGWRKYSPIDAVWINIVTELRKFNVSLRLLKAIKLFLTQHSDDTDYSKMPLLEIAIRGALLQKNPIFIKIFEDGVALIGSYQDILISDKIRLLNHHISLNLNIILNQIFPDLDFNPNHGFNWNLSKAEETLLLDLRSGQFTDIDIETREGKIKRFNAAEIIKDKVVFSQLAKEYSHQKIESNIKDNKVVSTKRSISKKF
jgi:DNA-binding transcriptional MerR regulator